MGQFRAWYSTESFADYIIDNTALSQYPVVKSQMYESDASKPKNFHKIPDHIKKILYLDAPDLIVEYNTEPIFSIEITTEAGTGHNAFQRFARIAAAVENDVPAIYIYPEAAIISRRNKNKEKGDIIKWDNINPLIFRAMDRIMSIYRIPALLFYYPSDYNEYPNNPIDSPNYGNKGLKMDTQKIKYAGCPEHTDVNMIRLFDVLNRIIEETISKGVIPSRQSLLSKIEVMNHKDWMLKEFNKKDNGEESSPITATIKIKTEYLLKYLSKFSEYKSELLASREETIIYQVAAKFRGDPYPGALAALDYLTTREGKTFEERKYNLVLCWGKVKLDDENLIFENAEASVNDFVTDVQSCMKKSLLSKNYNELSDFEIPRYYMQVRYGSTYSKAKHIRVYSYFADAILFKDGALWRDA